MSRIELAELSERERERALEKYRVVQSILRNGVTVTRAASAFGISTRTLSRWLRNYHYSGLAGLARTRRSDHGKRRKFNDETVQAIEGLALQNPAPSLAHIYRQIVALTAAHGWDAPSYGTVSDVVKHLERPLLALAQTGTKAYREEFDLIYRREASHPNEIWQADHSVLDIWLIGNDGKARRPWLTIIIDDYSRAVAGYFLSFQSPNSLNTALALRQAIWYKEDPRWHVCGIPDVFYTDHGSDFTSKHMEQVGADIKMQLIFSTPGVPRGRGRIERFFQSVNQLFLCGLPGYCPPERPHARTKASLNMEQFEGRFKDFLLGDYHTRIHSAINASPQSRWEAKGFLPRLPESLEQLDLLLLTVGRSRRVRQDGIHFNGFRYSDLILADYVGEEVTVRYDPRDMAEIRVYHQEQFLCRPICQELAGHTIGLKDIIQARDRRRRQLRDEIKQRTTMVETLLSSRRLDLDCPGNDPKSGETSGNSTAQARLKRYRNE